MDKKTTRCKETELYFWEEGGAVYNEDYKLSEDEKTAIDYIKKNLRLKKTDDSRFIFVPHENKHTKKIKRFGMTEFILSMVLLGFILEAFISF